jgi:hypothetical protein
MFLWGVWTKQTTTYFSVFLSPNGPRDPAREQDLYITPMADTFCDYWSGRYPAERAPILTRISIQGRNDRTDAVVRAGDRFRVTASATDPDTPTDRLHYRWWILADGSDPVLGPIDTTQPEVELQAPATPGTGYAVMAYVIDPDQGASGFTVPFKVESGQTARMERSDLMGGENPGQDGQPARNSD